MKGTVAWVNKRAKPNNWQNWKDPAAQEIKAEMLKVLKGEAQEGRKLRHT